MTDNVNSIAENREGTVLIILFSFLSQKYYSPQVLRYLGDRLADVHDRSGDQPDAEQYDHRKSVDWKSQNSFQHS